MKFIKSDAFMSVVSSYIIEMPTAVNISYVWNIGSLLALCFVIQLVSGLGFAMVYVPSIVGGNLAIESVEYVMSDVDWGWLVSYMHANGASIIIICVYVHIGSTMYIGSYNNPSSVVWIVGIFIYVMMMAIGILGYVFPYGQMSHWGATVITNMFSSIPVVGYKMVNLIWGNIGVNNETLKSIIVIHMVLTIVFIALIIVHLVVFHDMGGNNPLGLSSNVDSVSIHPYIVWKDVMGILAILVSIIIVVIWIPGIIMESDNYVEANPMVTPLSIVPEWYLLANYTILSAIPSKIGGVVLMILGIIVLAVFPWADSSIINSNSIKSFNNYGIWWILVIYFLLMWIGTNHVEYPYVEIGSFVTILYIGYILLWIPIVSSINNVVMLYSG